MKLIGIDLGTTNSCVYYLDESGAPVLAMDSKKRKIFPSAVWFDAKTKEVIVGHAAKVRLGQEPPPVVTVKRLMGTTETVNLGGKKVTPVEVSAHILRYAKKIVEEATGDSIGGVVVTVPAYFDAAPKNDTWLAAVQAFFDGNDSLAKGRLELQLEPEAAAYAYASADAAQQLRVLVYDLGGGTFDVTILEKSEAAGLAVIKFGGDPHLGGDNIDDRVAAWFLYLLRGGKPEAVERVLTDGRYPEDKKYTVLQLLLANDVAGLDGDLRPEDRDLLLSPNPPFVLELDIRNPEDLKRIQTLKLLAETAKKDLTASSEAVIAKQGAFADQCGDTVDIDLTLSRAQFDLLVGDMIARTIECTQHVLAESGQEQGSIDRILLVGGSSRMPVVREKLERIFECPIQLADPDLIVARGAALRAGALSPAPLGETASESALALQYPRETPDNSVSIAGRLGTKMHGHAYLLKDRREIDDAPVGEGGFHFRNVQLEPNARNVFRVEVMDNRENLAAEAECTIVHNENAIAMGDRLVPKITKPIRVLTTNGYHTLFPEGEALPATKPEVCYRATQDDHIDIEFYEGERQLSTLRISEVDPNLREGAPIDLAITITETYSVSATATIRETGQSQTVDFKITRLHIPPVEEMDRDFDRIYAEIDNDLNTVRDLNRRTTLYTRAARLAAEYKKARKALSCDMHKLYSTIGELQTLLIEIRAAQSFLEPPLEEVKGLLSVCRGLANRLPESGAVRRADVLERIGHLERAADETWKREDEPEWRRIYQEARRLHEQMGQAVREAQGGGGRREPPSAIEIQRAVIAWLAEIREKAEKHRLIEQVASEIDNTARTVKETSLRDAEEARNFLMEIVETKVRPLENRVDRIIESQGGRAQATAAKIRI